MRKLCIFILLLMLVFIGCKPSPAGSTAIVEIKSTQEPPVTTAASITYPTQAITGTKEETGNDSTVATAVPTDTPVPVETAAPTPTSTPELDSPVRKNGRKVTSASELRTYDIVTFGAYPNRSYREYADIEWIVLSTDGNKATLLARDLLDSCPFHRRDVYVSWEYSDLNRWLNEDFMLAAFHGAEMTMLSGSITIPSVEEARALPPELLNPGFTRYSITRGADSQQGIWWLRDRNQEVIHNGMRANVASVVQRGQILEAYYRVTFHGKGIRPMLQLDFDCLDRYNQYSAEKEDTMALKLLKKNGRTLTTSDDIRLYDVITFGNYPEAANGSAAPIRWVVIEKNGTKIRLLSEMALDYQRYQYPYGIMSWQFCTLNRWLNSTFRDAAFSSEEQSVLKNGVDLLGSVETRELPTDLRIASSTQYAVSRGADPSLCLWWLKDTMMVDNTVFCASTVLADGEVVDDYFGVASSKAVRPVIEIDLTVPAR